MNSEQLRLFINGAFGSEADARKVKSLLDPYLRGYIEEIRQMVEELPDMSLTRTREWRRILDRIEAILEPYSETLALNSRGSYRFRGGCCRRDDFDVEVGCAKGCGRRADSTRSGDGRFDQVPTEYEVNGRRVLGSLFQRCLANRLITPSPCGAVSTRLCRVRSSAVRPLSKSLMLYRVS